MVLQEIEYVKHTAEKRHGMQSFNKGTLDESGVNITIPECVEFISTLLFMDAEIRNKKITELYNADDIDAIVSTLMAGLNYGYRNEAYDMIEFSGSDFNPDQVLDLIEHCITQVKKYVLPFFDGMEEIKYSDIIMKAQECQNLSPKFIVDKRIVVPDYEVKVVLRNDLDKNELEFVQTKIHEYVTLFDMYLHEDGITYSKKKPHKKYADIPAGANFYFKLEKMKEYFSRLEYYNYAEADLKERILRKYNKKI